MWTLRHISWDRKSGSSGEEESFRGRTDSPVGKVWDRHGTRARSCHGEPGRFQWMVPSLGTTTKGEKADIRFWRRQPFSPNSKPMSPADSQVRRKEESEDGDLHSYHPVLWSQGQRAPEPGFPGHPRGLEKELKVPQRKWQPYQPGHHGLWDRGCGLGNPEPWDRGGVTGAAAEGGSGHCWGLGWAAQAHRWFCEAGEDQDAQKVA